MDLLETPSFTGIILLQTVLDELRNRSLPLYNRLRAMTKTDRKGMYIFHNDFRAETYVTRTKGETINDRNDRGISLHPQPSFGCRAGLMVAIREAAKWYKKHLTASMRASKIKVPGIVLLSNDQGNLEKAKSEGVAAVSSMNSYSVWGVIVVETYIKDLEDGDTLLDMMSANAGFERTVTKRGENIYPEYFSSARIQAGIQSQTLHSGVISISPYNFLEAAVSNPTPDGKPYLIVGRENINRAVHGDVVAIQVLPESEWRGGTDTIVEEGDITRGENADVDEEDGEVEDEVEARERKILKEERENKNTKGIQITAKVVGIIKRNWRT